jgi:hypothetical protein
VGQRLHHQGLRETGHADQQSVRVRERAGEQEVDRGILPDDCLVQPGADGGDAFQEPIDRQAGPVDQGRACTVHLDHPPFGTYCWRA